MPLPLLELSKYLLIGIIWLIFFRILRAIWVEVRATTAPQKAAVPTSAQAQGANMTFAQGAGGAVTSARPVVRFELVCIEGPYTGKNYVLGPETVIGRANDTTIAIPEDSFASSRHSRVIVKDALGWVEDLGSTNGTRLNHELVREPTQLSSGDEITVGKSVFKVVTV